MSKLFALKQQKEEALKKAEAIVSAAEQGNRDFTEAETQDVNAALAEARGLDPQIKAIEELNTLRSAFPRGIPTANANAVRQSASFASAEYLSGLEGYIRSNGLSAENLGAGRDELGGFRVVTRTGAMRAANYEGGATSGAPTIPVTVSSEIVPLAPPVIGVESLAQVIPTTMDLKFPRKKAHGAAAAKAEGTGNGSNVFTGTSPQTEQYTLSAFMVGHPEDISWELSQDVPAFLAFLQDDILLSISVLKESWYVSGSGSGQAQGLLGNVGAGITGAVADTDDNLLSIDATEDVLGKLNPVYKPNSAWLMTTATGIAIRKAQRQANLFQPVFTTLGDKDYLHGRPITYSSAMPEIAAGATPVLYGDFKAGYQIGIRGGTGVNIKFLDQPKALEGLLTVLGYQRVDGRVRRSEAIQGITLHS